jgi:hypothetical protein
MDVCILKTNCLSRSGTSAVYALYDMNRAYPEYIVSFLAGFLCLATLSPLILCGAVWRVVCEAV